MIPSTKLQSESGFTLVELLVVMFMTVMLTGLIMSFTLDFWGRTTSLQNSSDNLVTRQSLGDKLRDSFNRAIGLVIQPSISDTQTLAPDPDQVSGSYWLPLHAVPETKQKPASGLTNPIIYFNAPSVHSDRTQIMNGSQPYLDEYVMYLTSSGQLRLRTLANPSASGNAAKTTCTPSQTSETCGPDRLLATDVSSVALRYFSRSGNLQDWHSIIDPETGLYIGPDMPSVEVVELTATFDVKAKLKKSRSTKASTTIRVAFRNG